MNTLNDLLAVYNRALTAYDDCPEHRDAHTLAASRFYAIDYEDVTPYQRAWVKHVTFAYRGSQTITVDHPTFVTEHVPPGCSLNLTHPGSFTGRTTKRELLTWRDLSSTWMPLWTYGKSTVPVQQFVYPRPPWLLAEPAAEASHVSFRVSGETVAALT